MCMRMGGLATDVGTQTVRNIHGEYSKRGQVKCTSCDHHRHIEAPVDSAHATVVVGGLAPTELRHEVRLKADWQES